jgi:ATP-dependent Clp protease ATP-binding subunit ClpA
VVVFHPLTEADVCKITDLLIENSGKLMASQGIKMEVSPKARNFLAKRGFDPDLGARPLRRLIQREVENPISNAIVSGEYKEGLVVAVDLVGEKLTFQPLKKRVSLKV